MTPRISDESTAENVDLRHDFPRYMVYQHGVLTKSHCLNVATDWQEDHIGFLMGCSYSFKSALADAVLIPPHIALGRNVAMYRTNLPLCPAGVFDNSTYIVSMRPYKRKDVEWTCDITRPYTAVQGEPVAWGWGAVRRWEIADINVPEWGDAPLTLDGEQLTEGMGQCDEEIVPVFWLAVSLHRRPL